MVSTPPSWLARLRWQMQRPSEAVARARRPSPLPPVEAELSGAPPRPIPWADLSEDIEALIRDGSARRAWVTDVLRWRDAEGIEIRARLAFEDGQRLIRTTKSYSLDAYHAYVGSREYMGWLDTSMKAGGTVTVLWPRDRPQQITVYGDLELVLPSGGFAAR